DARCSPGTGASRPTPILLPLGVLGDKPAGNIAVKTEQDAVIIGYRARPHDIAERKQRVPVTYGRPAPWVGDDPGSNVQRLLMAGIADGASPSSMSTATGSRAALLPPCLRKPAAEPC